MLDIKFVRENPDKVQKNADQKGCKDVDVKKVLELDLEYRKILDEVEKVRAEKNELATRMVSTGSTTGPVPELVEGTIKKGKEIKERLAELEPELKRAETEFIIELKKVPNMADADVPVGSSDDENVIIKTIGEIPTFDFEIKNHAQIGEARGWIDKERATKVAGPRFAYLKGDLVRLEWAMMTWAMDVLMNEDILKKIISDNNLQISSKPFIPVLPPHMIKTELYDAMDRLEPRDDRYKIEGEELWLQGSAEHTLGSMHADEIFLEEEMPVRYVGFATSYRKEAGTYGKDMEGIIRMHQFNKLEMESFSVGEHAPQEHLFMVAIQEYLMQQLEIPYQVLQKCTYDIGKPNARGVDINAWLPGQNKYRETHTADYMTDYQARRLNTRVRRKDGSLQLVHTNDATALPQRPLVAILENNQRANGTITVPKVLRAYMGGKEIL